jgi:hypothetical protein
MAQPGTISPIHRNHTSITLNGPHAEAYRGLRRAVLNEQEAKRRFLEAQTPTHKEIARRVLDRAMEAKGLAWTVLFEVISMEGDL